MIPATELDRLFAQVFPSIPKPDALEGDSVFQIAPVIDFTGAVNKHAKSASELLKPFRSVTVPLHELQQSYGPSIDADETANGICAQGED